MLDGSEVPSSRPWVVHNEVCQDAIVRSRMQATVSYRRLLSWAKVADTQEDTQFCIVSSQHELHDPPGAVTIVSCWDRSLMLLHHDILADSRRFCPDTACARIFCACHAGRGVHRRAAPVTGMR